MNIQPVNDWNLRVTDASVLTKLDALGIDKDFVEFNDYCAERPYSKLYIDRQSRQRIQVISQLPMARKDDGSRITPGWEMSGQRITAKNNLFECEIDGARLALSVTNDQPSGLSKHDELVWNPVLMVGGSEVPLLSHAILETDPTNDNYHDNVIEYDYGVCKRYLRVIEGRIREWWTFTEKPTGEVRVQHNQEGGAFLHLGRGRSGLEPIELAVENGDVEILKNLDYQLPIHVGASATFYPDASPETSSVDGWAEHTQDNQAWNTLRGAAGTGSDDSNNNLYLFRFVTGTSSDTYSNIRRGIFLFDTSSLGSGSIPSAAVLSVRGESKLDQISVAANAILGVVSSNPSTNTAIIGADYATIGATLLSDTITYDNILTTATFNDFTLTTAGVSTITPTGVSKFGMREDYYDRQGNTPPWLSPVQSYITAHSSEQGSGFKPQLVVTYIPPPTPQLITNTGTAQAVLTGYGYLGIGAEREGMVTKY